MNTYYVGSIPISDELYHHGIKGQKWGIRRYQNEDGTLTTEGKARYGETREERKQAKFELSANRGEQMIAKGRTKAGALLRGVGRQLALEGASYVSNFALASLSFTALMNPAVAPIVAAGSVFVSGSKLGLTVANAVKSVKDYRDIARAEGKTYLEKNTRK